MRAMRLAHAGEQFAHRDELFLQAEAPVAAQPREIVQAGGDRIGTRTDEAVGFRAAVGARAHLRIARAHGGPRPLSRRATCPPLVIGVMPIDTRFPPILSFSPPLGHPGTPRAT